jgi:serine/threonine-protein kinase
LRAEDAALTEELASLVACAPLADDLFRQLPRAAAAIAAELVSSGGDRVTDRTGEGWADDRPGATVAQYRIEDVLGRGGMGVVYRATDTRLDRIVALKFLPPHRWVDRQARERLLLEARAVAALDHPNICTVHEVGETPEGVLFLAMPYYEGETLRERLTRGPLNTGAAADIATQAARALAAAHARGIVHRDVKPANLMLTSTGTVKLLDFGLARLADVTVTASGQTPGTIAYMPPERVRGERADVRSDLWALGVVLFEMLTGERPFRGDSEAAVLHAILNQHVDVRRASAGGLAVPEAMARVVEQLLRKKPAERYQTASELLADLSAFGNGEAVPRRASFRWLRVPRMRRVRAEVAVLVLTVLVASALGVLARERLADAPEVDPEVFDLYLKGTQARYTLDPLGGNARVAADYFARAIAKDSGYAPAYAGLASMHAFSNDPTRARWSAEKALVLDPSLAEPHVVLGLIRQHHGWDWRGAEDSFREAIRLNPGFAEARHELSMLLTRLGRFDEALAEARHTLYLSPMSARFHHGLGEVYLWSGRYNEAVRAAEDARARDSSWSGTDLLLGAAYARMGKYSAALEALGRFRERVGSSVCVGDLGYVYAVSGQRDRAREVLKACEAEARKPNSGWTANQIATIYMVLGDRQQALRWLEHAVETRPETMVYLAVDRDFRSLRAEPRFQALLKKMRFDE